MKISVVAVGRLSSMWKDAAEEYKKRIGRYCSLAMLELPEEKTEGKLRGDRMHAALDKEAERILKSIPPGAFVCALDLQGEQFGSEEFAAWMGRMQDENRDLCFLIGSHLGLSQKILEKCQKLISFSPMTFPHQLARILLLEQVYRGFAILNHVPYHK
ncbi:MAG: 23S rRNA (pseudouridine(1915)-N(3))-methyltransferase RlmH [Christensenellales bacterium]